jgi:hypothetical protein
LTSNILKTPVLPYPAVFVLHPRPRSGDKNSGTVDRAEQAERGWQAVRGGAVRDKTPLFFCFGAAPAHSPRSRPSLGLKAHARTE